VYWGTPCASHARSTAAYYLAHSMLASSDFHQLDPIAAQSGEVERIIYLDGLAESTSTLLEHLCLRLQTGDAASKQYRDFLQPCSVSITTQSTVLANFAQLAAYIWGPASGGAEAVRRL
jgi:hypothetical protein